MMKISAFPKYVKSIGMSRSQLHLKIKALTNRSTSTTFGFPVDARPGNVQHHRPQRDRDRFEVGFRDAIFLSVFSAEFIVSRDYLKTLSQYTLTSFKNCLSSWLRNPIKFSKMRKPL